MSEKKVIFSDSAKTGTSDSLVKTNYITPEHTFKNPYSVYLLGVMRKEKTPGQSTEYPIIACMCNACKKITQLDPTITQTNLVLDENIDHKNKELSYSIFAYRNDSLSVLTHSDYSEQKTLPQNCPECNEPFKLAGLCIPEEENGKSVWKTPVVVDGRRIIAETENEKPVKIEDTTTGTFYTIDQDYNISRRRLFFVETNNLKTKQSHYVETEYQNGEIKNKTITTKMDPIKHKKDFDAVIRGERKFQTKKEADLRSPIGYDVTSKNRFEENRPTSFINIPIINDMMNKPITNSWNIRSLQNQINNSHNNLFDDIKNQIILQQFETKYPIMTNTSDNKLYLDRIDKDSTAENSDNTNFNKKHIIMQMMVNYPAAFEYAIQRAEQRVSEYEYAQKRKQKENPEYEPKTVTEPGKALFAREEIEYVASQLFVIDKKILDTIHRSKNADDMRKKLNIIVSGNKDADMSGLNIDIKNAKQDPIQNTKYIKAKMRENPIGVANTIYTCIKMGIKDTSSIKDALNLTFSQERSVDLDKKRRTSKKPVFPKKEQINDYIKENTMHPIETKAELQFVKNLVNTHSPGIMIGENGIYRSKEKQALFEECINIYTEIKRTGAIIQDGSTEESKQQIHDEQKSRIKSYLQRHSVTDAYIDFCTAFGAKTPETINDFINEIKLDKKMKDISDFAKNHSMDETIKTYEKDLSFLPDPKEYITNYQNKNIDQNRIILATQNGKPLFANRTLNEIHDELSHMNKKLVNENKELESYYPEEIKDMQKTYDSPDGLGQWSFHIHKDSYDVIRSATELHNCMGSSHVNDILYGTRYTMYMQDETGRRVAGIELKVSKNPDYEFEVTQFQGDHDNALDKEHASIALKWLEDCKIDARNCRDVSLFGTGKSIYGAETADYHDDEIDDATNTIVSKQKHETEQNRRIEMAKQLYNYNDETGYDFGVKVPEYNPINF